MIAGQVREAGATLATRDDDFERAKDIDVIVLTGTEAKVEVDHRKLPGASHSTLGTEMENRTRKQRTAEQCWSGCLCRAIPSDFISGGATINNGLQPAGSRSPRMQNRIRELVDPLRRQDFSALLRTVRDDPEIVVRHLLNQQHRVVPEHALETSPRPSQIEELVRVLFPEVSANERLAAWLELRDDAVFRTEINATLRSTNAGPGRVCGSWRELLYLLVRHEQPDVVVETGVRGGLSSAFILNALSKNENGRLISVDIGDESLIPDDIENPEVGWMVPERLRDRWDLRLGDSEELLSAIFSNESVDMFFSDVPNSILESELTTAIDFLDTGSVITTCYPLSSDAKTIWREFSKDTLDPVVTGTRWQSEDEESKIAIGMVK